LRSSVAVVDRGRRSRSSIAVVASFALTSRGSAGRSAMDVHRAHRDHSRPDHRRNAFDIRIAARPLRIDVHLAAHWAVCFAQRAMHRYACRAAHRAAMRSMSTARHYAVVRSMFISRPTGPFCAAMQRAAHGAAGLSMFISPLGRDEISAKKKSQIA
jgi:hypothetical protein